MPDKVTKVAEVVEKVEEVKEQVTEEVSEKLNRLGFSINRTQVAISLVSLGVGIGIGYIIGQRKKKIKVIAKPDVPLEINVQVDDLDGIRLAQQASNALSPASPSTDKLAEAYKIVEARKKASAKIEIHPVKDEVELVTKSIFDPKDDTWDVAKEANQRSRHEPYVVHRDEFFDSEENGYRQSQFTYYAGDDILCDNDNTPVYNHAQVTGPLLFGHGSGDPNIVYIRNDSRKEEYEIMLDQGMFSKEVMGLDIEDNTRVNDLRHTRNRRLRQGDNE